MCTIDSTISGFFSQLLMRPHFLSIFLVAYPPPSVVLEKEEVLYDNICLVNYFGGYLECDL